MNLPESFIVATIIYVISRICKRLDKNDESSWPVDILAFASGIMMAYTGIMYLFSVI